MIGSALAIGGQVLGWIWNHKLLALCIALAVALAWSRHQLGTVTIERDAAQSQIEAEQGKTKTAYLERDIWQASYEGAAAALKDVRAQLDALDVRAKAQQETADRKVRDLAAERDAALSRAETFRTELERKAHEPGATAASVGRAALEGLN